MVTNSNVRVLARVRPALPHEYQFDQAVEVLSATKIRLNTAKQSYESSYDRVLPENSSQELVYAQVRDCVPSLLKGYNNTVLAYGQTGTGKTYTMIGDQGMTLAEACSVPCSATGHGIMPRAMYDLFVELDRWRAAAPAGGCDLKLVVSYLEIYNDRLYDLLQPYKRGSSRDPSRIQAGKTSLEVREDPMAGTHVPNLLYVDTTNCKQVLQLVAAGNSNRATAHTDMNRHSSRSHAILQLWLEQRPAATAAAGAGGGGGGVSASSSDSSVVVRSKLNFVDLAGSERWGRAHTEAEGKTLINELTSINNSLSALALVVAALTDKSAKHVPYRSSRLTHLLQDSLGGNCNTSLLVTLAPCVDAFDDSMAALKFADRARNIANRAVVNSTHDTDTILAVKEREIQRLRALLATYTSAAGGVNNATQQQQWQQWAAAGDDDAGGIGGSLAAVGLQGQQQDPMLLPHTNPSTPQGPTSSSSSFPRAPHSPPSHGRQAASSAASAGTTANSTAASAAADHSAGAAAVAAAAERAALESELAATRAALALERSMRSELEGQLQEVSSQVQQQATAAGAAAGDAAAGTGSVLSQAAATSMSVRQPVSSRESRGSRGSMSSMAAWPTLRESQDEGTSLSQVAAARAAAAAAAGVPAAAAASYPNVTAHRMPVAAAWGAGAVLSSMGSGATAGQQQQARHQQKQQEDVQHVKAARHKAAVALNVQQQQHRQQQHQAEAKQQGKQHGPKPWMDRWQALAVDEQRKAAHSSSSSDHPGSNNKASSSSSPFRGESQQKSSSLLPSGIHPLRSSWSSAYGGTGASKGKWHNAAAGAKGAAAGQAKAAARGAGVSAAGFHTARESGNASGALSSLSPAIRAASDAWPGMTYTSGDGDVPMPRQSNSPKLKSTPSAGSRGGAAATRQISAVPAPLFARSSPSSLQTLAAAAAAAQGPQGPKKAAGKQHQQQQQRGAGTVATTHSSSVAGGSSSAGSGQARLGASATAGAAAASGTASPPAGWGRSWLLQQVKQQAPGAAVNGAAAVSDAAASIAPGPGSSSSTAEDSVAANPVVVGSGGAGAAAAAAAAAADAAAVLQPKRGSSSCSNTSMLAQAAANQHDTEQTMQGNAAGPSVAFFKQKVLDEEVECEQHWPQEQLDAQGQEEVACEQYSERYSERYSEGFDATSTADDGVYDAASSAAAGAEKQGYMGLDGTEDAGNGQAGSAYEQQQQRSSTLGRISSAATSGNRLLAGSSMAGSFVYHVQDRQDVGQQQESGSWAEQQQQQQQQAAGLEDEQLHWQHVIDVQGQLGDEAEEVAEQQQGQCEGADAFCAQHEDAPAAAEPLQVHTEYVIAADTDRQSLDGVAEFEVLHHTPAVGAAEQEQGYVQGEALHATHHTAITPVQQLQQQLQQKEEEKEKGNEVDSFYGIADEEVLSEAAGEAAGLVAGAVSNEETAVEQQEVELQNDPQVQYL